MSKEDTNLDSLQRRTVRYNTPAEEGEVRLLAISQNQFLAHWSLSEASVAPGRRGASGIPGSEHLVLRVYFLPPHGKSTDLSNNWRDYPIRGRKNSKRVKFSAPTAKINAVVGLIHSDGRFSPLARGKAINLPFVPAPRPSVPPRPEVSASGSPAAPPEAEAEELQTETTSMLPPANGTEIVTRANQPGSSSVQLHATLTIGGKIAPDTKLMMGNEILKPDADGFVTWKRELNSSEQIWPLLKAALTCPSAPAGPTLEFFKNIKNSDRLLELQASLEVEGKVSDSGEFEKRFPTLPLDPDGRFKLSQLLPAGAVILPGLSLVSE